MLARRPLRQPGCDRSALGVVLLARLLLRVRVCAHGDKEKHRVFRKSPLFYFGENRVAFERAREGAPLSTCVHYGNWTGAQSRYMYGWHTLSVRRRV